MSKNNPFPESIEKDYLRRFHLLHSLADYQELVGRPLAYFGLPSAEMRDVAMWHSLLGHVTAIERDPTLALQMYRAAQKLGIREKTIVIEMQLAEIAKLLAMEDKEAKLSLALQWPSVQNKINLVRNIRHDVINLDLCGGFLYQDRRGESENAKVLRHLIEFQAKLKTTFIMIITFALRDTGKDDYDDFIIETLEQLGKVKIDTSDLRKYYLADDIEGQPPNLRRLRFCLPAYLHKVAFEYFHVRNLGAWYYKTFYHTALFFEPHHSRNALGKTWPPVEEFKELLRTPMLRLEPDNQGQILKKSLPAPTLL